jgi:hypothetical protein
MLKLVSLNSRFFRSRYHGVSALEFIRLLVDVSCDQSQASFGGSRADLPATARPTSVVALAKRDYDYRRLIWPDRPNPMRSRSQWK